MLRVKVSYRVRIRIRISFRIRTNGIENVQYRFNVIFMFRYEIKYKKYFQG